MEVQIRQSENDPDARQGHKGAFTNDVIILGGGRGFGKDDER